MKALKALQDYKQFLLEQEKSENTITKYLSEADKLLRWLAGKEISKNNLLVYKQYLAYNHSPTGANAAISSVNNYLAFFGLSDLKIKTFKVQRQVFRQPEKELSKLEYERLLQAAKKTKNWRLYHIMQTICATGIRISELRYITVEAVASGKAEIRLKGKKGKIRTILLPDDLCRLLKKYIKQNGIISGSIFTTKSGKPVNRSNIWREMKKLCRLANVNPKKVFPHNLRHLFARVFYKKYKDIVRLADVLGHSSVNTTRIYTMESGETHRRQINNLGLLACG